MGEKHAGKHQSHVALVEAEAYPDDIWKPHTERQLRRMHDFAESSPLTVVSVLAVPPKLKKDAKALIRSLGFPAIQVWSF